MKKTRATIAALFLLGILSGLNLHAQPSGFADRGERSLDGRTWQWYQNQAGLSLYVAKPLPADAAGRISPVLAAIASWRQVSISELRVELGRESDDYIVHVSRLEYEGKDFAAAVPAGLRLRFEGVLMYDFRVRSGDYFARVRGVLMTETAMLAEMAKAVADPIAYVSERDPAWTAQRIAELQDQLDKLQNTQEAALENLRHALAARMNRSLFGLAAPLEAEAIGFVLEYRQANPVADNNAIVAAAKAAGIKLSGKQVEIIRLVWP